MGCQDIPVNRWRGRRTGEEGKRPVDTGQQVGVGEKQGEGDRGPMLADLPTHCCQLGVGRLGCQLGGSPAGPTQQCSNL